MTAARRGRRRGGSAPRSAPLCLRLCAHLLPNPPSVPGPRNRPRTPTPTPTLPRPPAPTPRYATRGRRVSALSRPPGAPSHDPNGRGAPGAMRGQGRKESLSDSRDLDGSYDQLTGKSMAWGSQERG